MYTSNIRNNMRQLIANNLDTTQMGAKEQFNNFIQEHGLTLETQFVPYTTKEHNSSTPNVNWLVKLSTVNGSITIPYTKELNELNLPAAYASQPATQEQHVAVFESTMTLIETGFIPELQFHKEGIKVGSTFNHVPSPNLEEVLYSLMNISNIKDYSNYTSWDADWQSGTPTPQKEKAFNQDKKTINEFLEVIGGEKKMDKLKDIVLQLAWDKVYPPDPKQKKLPKRRF